MGLGPLEQISHRSFCDLKTSSHCAFDHFNLKCQATASWFIHVDLWQYQEQSGVPHDTPSGVQELWVTRQMPAAGPGLVGALLKKTSG